MTLVSITHVLQQLSVSTQRFRRSTNLLSRSKACRGWYCYHLCYCETKEALLNSDALLCLLQRALKQRFCPRADGSTKMRRLPHRRIRTTSSRVTHVQSCCEGMMVCIRFGESVRACGTCVDRYKLERQELAEAPPMQSILVELTAKLIITCILMLSGTMHARTRDAQWHRACQDACTRHSC
jgi:hypothetical protein